MLRIRLRRQGKKKKPFYHIVVTQKENPVQGKYIASLGYFDPINVKRSIDKDKTMSWLNNGAVPSNTVSRILKKEGLKHKLIVVKIFNKKAKGEKKETEKIVEKKAEVMEESQKSPVIEAPADTKVITEKTENKEKADGKAQDSQAKDEEKQENPQTEENEKPKEDVKLEKKKEEKVPTSSKKKEKK